MKRILSICMLTTLAFVACDKEKNGQTDGTLTGTWRQVSYAQSSGGPIQVYPVALHDAEIMGFGTTGQFTSNVAQRNYNRYSNDDSTLILKNSVTGETFKYYYRIKSDTMTISPLTVRCVEGCYSRYVKVVMEER